MCCQGRPEGGVHLIGNSKLFAGVQDQGCNGRVMGVADAREEVVYDLQGAMQIVSTLLQRQKSWSSGVCLNLVLLADVLCHSISQLWYYAKKRGQPHHLLGRPMGHCRLHDA